MFKRKLSRFKRFKNKTLENTIEWKPHIQGRTLQVHFNGGGHVMDIPKFSNTTYYPSRSPMPLLISLGVLGLTLGYGKYTGMIGPQQGVPPQQVIYTRVADQA